MGNGILLRHKTFWVLGALAIALIIALIAGTQSSGQTTSKAKSGGPALTWTPSSFATTVPAGASNSFQVSVASAQILSNVTVRVVPELEAYIRVSPQTFDSLLPGQSLPVTIMASIPATTGPQEVEGAIQIRATDANGKSIARPLPVALNITWSSYTDAQTGVQFSYPSFGVPSRVQVLTNHTGGQRLAAQFKRAQDATFVTGFSVLVIMNTNHFSLADWFHRNVDTDGSLIANGTFVEQTLANGQDALLLAGAVPNGYDGGPLPDAYGISASGNTVIVLAISQTGELDSLGLTSDQTNQLLTEILSSLQAP